MPKFTVLLAVYNNKDDVLNAIRSIIDQTFTDWELIVIDDCSTDETYNIVDQFIQCHPEQNIVLLHNSKNKGVYSSLNEGLLKATGDIIARVDSDDTLHKQFLELYNNIFDNNSNVISVQSHYHRDNTSTKHVGEVTLSYRREVINKIGYYDSVRFAADTEFVERIKKVYGKSRMHLIDEILYFAKKRDNSLTTSEETGLKSKAGIKRRKDYVTSYRKWHSGNNKDEIFMPYPLASRLFPVPDKMQP